MNGSLSVLYFGGRINGSVSVSVTDYRNMNGDGIPDVVLAVPGVGTVVLRTERGAPRGVPFVPYRLGGAGLRASVNASVGIQRGPRNVPLSIPLNPSLSAGATVSNTLFELMDMNGDGLADEVATAPTCPGLLVRLSLGDRYDDPCVLARCD